MTILDRNIGIDFGTSTTVLCYLDHREGRPDSIEPHFVKWGDLQTTLLPSLIFDTPGGKPLFGCDALDASKKESRRGSLVRNFKMDLLVAEKREQAVEKMVSFFSYLRQQYVARRLRTPGVILKEHTFVSFPAKWPEPLRKLTIEAAGKAGFPDVQGVDEPTAAMQFFLSQETSDLETLRERDVITWGLPLVALLIDMGAGTTDFVLFRTTLGATNGHELLSTWPQIDGANFGGREIDARLGAYLTAYLKANLIDPGEAEAETARWKSEIILHKERDISAILLQDGIVDHCAPIATLRHYKALRTDSEAYSVDRESFGKLLNGDLQTFADLVNGVLDDARTNGIIQGNGDVDLVLLTGGHSQWYFVPEMLRGKWVPGLPGAPESGSGIHLPKIMAEPGRVVTSLIPQEIVARGLARTGLEEIDIVKRAANNLWYEVAVGGCKVHLRVVKRGEILPYDATHHQRIPLQRKVTDTIIDACVVPVAGPTIEQGDRYSNHPIECKISKMTLGVDRSRIIAQAAGIQVGSNVSKGLAGISKAVGSLSQGIANFRARSEAPEGRLKTWGRKLVPVLDQFQDKLIAGAEKIKNQTDRIAQAETDVKEDQVDLILKVHVDKNEKIRYVGGLDLLSAGQWWLFWYNQDEPSEHEQRALWAEIKSRRQS